jgi:serine kinase of HPr protein (carbohydrate metabolism regulator)
MRTALAGAQQPLLHATCVAVGGVGVLLRGRPDAGKSDLALRLIDQGGRLIADDYVRVRRRRQRLIARAPAEIKGRIEVRGLGIVAVPARGEATVGLIVDLVGRGRIERMPKARSSVILGVKVPVLRMDPFQASTVAKIKLAVAVLNRRSMAIATALDRVSP